MHFQMGFYKLGGFMQQTKVFAKRTFQFPKIAYSSRRRVNLPEVEIELRLLDDNIYELSICGNVWNSTHSDIYMGGQCLDEMMKFDELKRNETFLKLYKLWKLYHLKHDIPKDVLNDIFALLNS